MNATMRPGGVRLLPPASKYLGLALLVPGLILVYFFMYRGIKPAFLDVRVPAIWSQYFETRYCVVIENNISEEITLFLLLASLFLIAGARVVDENDTTTLLRFRAMVLAAYINTAFLLCAIVFVYGIAFATVVFLNMFSGLALFILIFYVNYYRYKLEHSNTSKVEALVKD